MKIYGSTIIGFIIFGFIILIFTGIGILTNAIFNITEDKILEHDKNIIESIKTIPTSTVLTQLQINEIINRIPKTQSISLGKNIINIGGFNLKFIKIILIILWIFMIIGIFLISIFTFKYFKY